MMTSMVVMIILTQITFSFEWEIINRIDQSKIRYKD